MMTLIEEKEEERLAALETQARDAYVAALHRQGKIDPRKIIGLLRHWWPRAEPYFYDASGRKMCLHCGEEIVMCGGRHE